MRLITIILFCAGLLTAQPVRSQGKPDPAPAESAASEISYRLTFVVREFAGGKPAGSRSYSSLLTNTNEGGESIRSGSKIPITPPSVAETQYVEVGANFDFRISAEHGRTVSEDQLPLVIGADVSSIAKEGAPVPVIRQNRWRSSCLLTLGKPTLLFSSEDPTLDRTTQVELTVVKLP